MIICVSANPAIDRRLRIKNLKIGAINRAVSVEAFAGGKAAHVAMAARALGEYVIWIGFSGGATGDEIERQLRGLDIEVIAVGTKSATRINDEIIDESGQITEILEPGGNVSVEEIEEIYAVCQKAFADAGPDFQTVLSGSLPQGVPIDFYPRLISAARTHGGKVILDTSGEAFLAGIKSGPDLIKPNSDEAGAAADIKIEDEMSTISAIRYLQEMGARNVALSLGSRGIVWVGEGSDEAIFAAPPMVKVISTVGSGDAAVAGLAVAARRHLSDEESLRLAVACGTANCLAELPGQIDETDVKRLLPLVAMKTVGFGNQTKTARKLLC